MLMADDEIPKEAMETLRTGPREMITARSMTFWSSRILGAASSRPPFFSDHEHQLALHCFHLRVSIFGVLFVGLPVFPSIVLVLVSAPPALMAIFTAPGCVRAHMRSWSEDEQSCKNKNS
jgi:hypothetical protein